MTAPPLVGCVVWSPVVWIHFYIVVYILGGQPLLYHASVYHDACLLTVTTRRIIGACLSNRALSLRLYLSTSSLTFPCILFRVGDSRISLQNLSMSICFTFMCDAISGFCSGVDYCNRIMIHD